MKKDAQMFTSAASGILLTTSGPRIHAAPSALLPAYARGGVCRRVAGDAGTLPWGARCLSSFCPALYGHRLCGVGGRGECRASSTGQHGRPRTVRAPCRTAGEWSALLTDRDVRPAAVPTAYPATLPTQRGGLPGYEGTQRPHPKGTNACLVASTQLRVSRMAVSVPRRRLEASSVPATDPLGGRGRHRGPRPEHGLGPHLPGPGDRHVPFQVAELYNRDSVPPHSAQLQRGPPQGQAQAPGRAWQSGHTGLACGARGALGCRACLC